jgi:hypothetical protein
MSKYFLAFGVLCLGLTWLVNTILVESAASTVRAAPTVPATVAAVNQMALAVGLSSLFFCVALALLAIGACLLIIRCLQGIFASFAAPQDP